MIVLGVDTHKRSETAVAVEAASGAPGQEQTVAVSAAGHEQLLAWARTLSSERLWALEDCRHVSGPLERFLLARGELVLRVPPKLTAALRRRGRRPGKSDAIDALAIARAALREPDLPLACPQPALRELKLLVDYRDQLVDERRRAQSRLRWLLHELELELEIPPRALDRACWLERLGRRLCRCQPCVQVELARALVRRCRQLGREIAALEHELTARVQAQAPQLLELPGCGTLTAAKLLAEIGGIERFASEAKLAMLAGAAPLEAASGERPRHRLNRSGNRQLNLALHWIAITQSRLHPPAQQYLARKQAEGKSRREALRCLKRHLVRTVYRLLLEESSVVGVEAGIALT
jgi:transposase